jgi:hypothetical protein
LARVAFLAVRGLWHRLRNRILHGLPFFAVSGKLAAPSVVVVRDGLAELVISATLLARGIVVDHARVLVQDELALLRVAFLVVRVAVWGGSLEIFQFFRMRVVDLLPFQTLCAEVAAVLVVTVVRDALARLVNIARRLARRIVFGMARRLANPVLALVHVALLAVKFVLGVGGSCIIFQFLCMRVGDRLRFRTIGAEVAAPPVNVERDTLAVWCLHARSLARPETVHSVRRLGYVDLALGHIAFQFVSASVHCFGMRIVVFHCVLAASAEVVAPSVVVVRDAHAHT